MALARADGVNQVLSEFALTKAIGKFGAKKSRAAGFFPLYTLFFPVIFLEGFVGRLFREFGVVIGAAVLISAFVSLSLTPMLNAYMMKANKKKTKFYNWSEPYFEGMTTGYGNSLKNFMKTRWLAFPVIIICIGMIAFFWTVLQKETAPYDDRAAVSMQVTAPEGSSYDYTDNFILELSKLVEDSIPEKEFNLTVTSPGFSGSGAANTGTCFCDPAAHHFSVKAGRITCELHYTGTKF